MKPEAQRVAIAEACGWTEIQRDEIWCFHARYDKHVFCGRKYGIYTNLPDYLNDLNAMHEAERVLEGQKNWNRYTDELGEICYYRSEVHTIRSFVNIVVSATAAQRAKALLKTLNLWNNSL